MAIGNIGIAGVRLRAPSSEVTRTTSTACLLKVSIDLSEGIRLAPEVQSEFAAAL